MSLDTIIMLFGAIIAVLPFLQLPQNWTDFFAFLAGIVIIGLGVAVRRRGARYARQERQVFHADPSDTPSEH